MLDAFFDAGRKAAPQPSGDLMARILADADAEAARRVPVRTPVAQRGFWEALAGALGGRPGLASLATAAAVGVYIGFSPPAPLEDFAVTYLGAEDYIALVEFSPGFEDILTEG